jgi:hypothetical protein
MSQNEKMQRNIERYEKNEKEPKYMCHLEMLRNFLFIKSIPVFNKIISSLPFCEKFIIFFRKVMPRGLYAKV